MGAKLCILTSRRGVRDRWRGAVTGEDKTDRQPDRQTTAPADTMHYFQSQTRGSLQRQGPSTRDRQRINEVLLPACLQASSPCFVAKKEQGIQRPAALQRTRPAPAFPVNGPSLCVYVQRAGMTGFLLLCCD